MFGFVLNNAFALFGLTSLLGCCCRVTALLAVACHFVGYITIWAAAAGHIYLPYPVLLIMGVIASSTTATVDSACTGTEIRNFPNDRGHVVGKCVPSLSRTPPIMLQ